MFGYVSASVRELTKEQRERYGSVYCGICRRIGEQSSQAARLGLSYDMAFLALMLMSLYEPEETSDSFRCAIHPARKRSALDNACVRYAADMNVALAYLNFLDDWEDDGSRKAKMMASLFEKSMPRIRREYPRQCAAMENCIRELRDLEQANCPEPDACAHVFGKLMGELLVYRQDLWEDILRQMGDALGRFVYLSDAAEDYRADQRKKKYNPFLAMGRGENWDEWEDYLVLAMGRCTKYYEMLPLVRDKELLDNILYSGVWTRLHRRGREKRERK